MGDLTKHTRVWYTLSMNTETKNFTICYKDNDTSKMIVTLWNPHTQEILDYEEVNTVNLENYKFLEKLQKRMMERSSRWAH